MQKVKVNYIFIEILSSPAVISKMNDTKALSEIKTLETFYNTLMVDPDKALYGVKHVEKANENQAIEILLISDTLFRFFLSNFIYNTRCFKLIAFLNITGVVDRNKIMYGCLPTITAVDTELCNFENLFSIFFSF